jgi:hypothetical protein
VSLLAAGKPKEAERTSTRESTIWHLPLRVAGLVPPTSRIRAGCKQPVNQPTRQVQGDDQKPAHRSPSPFSQHRPAQLVNQENFDHEQNDAFDGREPNDQSLSLPRSHPGRPPYARHRQPTSSHPPANLTPSATRIFRCSPLVQASSALPLNVRTSATVTRERLSWRARSSVKSNPRIRQGVAVVHRFSSRRRTLLERGGKPLTAKADRRA